jgi:hypothetical protein
MDAISIALSYVSMKIYIVTKTILKRFTYRKRNILICLFLHFTINVKEVVNNLYPLIASLRKS